MATKYLSRDLLSGFAKSMSAAIIGGANSANAIPALGPNGTLDPSMFPAGIGSDLITCPASEAIASGALVNFWNNGGALNARNADSGTSACGKKTEGFTISAVASGTTASFYRSGQNTGLSGITIGNDYYMGATGAVTSSIPPETAGTTSQYIGKGISTTAVDVQPAPPVGIYA